MSNSAAEWRAERNAALRDLDMEWARHTLPDVSSDKVRLMAMHEARYECTDLADELRHASGAWLAKHNCNRCNGGALLRPGLLPR